MENTNNTAIERIEGESNFIANLTDDRRVSFSSINTESLTVEKKVEFFNAINTPEQRLKDMVNMPIKVKDVYVEEVICTNDETGERKSCPRIVLIDEQGKGYACVSFGVLGSLQKIFRLFGLPTWEKPVTIIPFIVSKGTKQITTLKVGA